MIVGLLGAAACAGGTEDEAGVGVGFILVGDRDDLGYNEAVWTGTQRVARAFPDVRVMTQENVPETDDAIEVLEGMIDRGATVLFATSFGHRDAAFEVARRHPDVVVVHQGGVEPEPPLDNFGTYFGTHSGAMYASGAAAGAETSAGDLGFVAAFEIPATFENVNAFLLGARSVRPDARVHVVFTDSWCDPARQRDAADALIGAGVDVIAQHQDCTRTVLEIAEERDIATVGYHADGSEVAPDTWLTGVIWTWDELFVDITEVALAGSFAGSPYDGDFRGTLADGNGPFALAEAGTRVAAETRVLIDEALSAFESGDRSVFDGPLVDDAGRERVRAGASLSPREAETMDYFLEGAAILDW